VCYILSMATHTCRGVTGGAQCPRYFFFGPYIRWANLPMVLCMDFAYGFGHDGFIPMVFCRSGQGNYGYVIIKG